MKIKLLIIWTVLCLTCCNFGPKPKSENQQSVIDVQSNDLEMNHAIEEAKKTLYKFKDALRSKNKDFSYFALKSKFKSDNGVEHIWISDVTIKNEKYIGVIDNIPKSITYLHIGDTIQLSYENISDWMYVDNNTLRGGYTIRLLRKRMSENERKRFDAEIKLVIE